MKKCISVILIIIATLILTLGGYASYVLISYDRIEDNQVLEVSKGETEASVPTNKELKILSYNIGFGAYSDDYTFFMDGGKESRCRSKETCKENVNGALEIAKENNADIYLFQEVDIEGTRAYGVNQLEMLKKGLGKKLSSSFAQNYDSPYLFWPLIKPHGANKSGIATFSRFEIGSALRRSLPIEDGFMKFVDLDRAYSVNRLKTDNGKELIIYNVHLSAYTSDGKVAEEQLKMLVSDMKNEYAKGNYCIAGGDFNKDLPNDAGDTEHTWAQPIPENLVPEELSLVAPKANPVKSCRDTGVIYDEGKTFTITVDGFVVSKNVEVIKSEVIDTGFKFTDHNPVFANVLLK